MVIKILARTSRQKVFALVKLFCIQLNCWKLCVLWLQRFSLLLVAKLLLSCKYPIVRMKCSEVNVIFYVPFKVKFLNFFSITNYYLFYNCLVRLSVGNSFATYGRTSQCIFSTIIPITKTLFK